MCVYVCVYVCFLYVYVYALSLFFLPHPLVVSGVEGQQDVDLLVQVFYNGQEEDDEALMVEPDDVLQHLKNFIQAMGCRR